MADEHSERGSWRLSPTNKRLIETLGDDDFRLACDPGTNPAAALGDRAHTKWKDLHFNHTTPQYNPRVIGSG
jgi:hypothetical protein